MNFGLERFFVGLMGFSILFPSALLTHQPIGEVGLAAMGITSYFDFTDAKAWVAFLVVTCLFWLRR